MRPRLFSADLSDSRNASSVVRAISLFAEAWKAWGPYAARARFY